jgi:hypothetical protein
MSKQSGQHPGLGHAAWRAVRHLKTALRIPTRHTLRLHFEKLRHAREGSFHRRDAETKRDSNG